MRKKRQLLLIEFQLVNVERKITTTQQNTTKVAVHKTPLKFMRKV